MLINYNEMTERTVPGMNGGTGEMSAKMLWMNKGKSSLAAFMLEVP